MGLGVAGIASPHLVLDSIVNGWRVTGPATKAGPRLFPPYPSDKDRSALPDRPFQVRGPTSATRFGRPKTPTMGPWVQIDQRCRLP